MTVSTRPTPTARRYGATAAAPASKLALKAGPVSNTRLRSAVRITADKPWPTSSRVSHASAGGGRTGATTISGSSRIRPIQRPGTPAGASSSSAPAAAGNKVQAGGAGWLHSAKPLSVSHCNSGHSQASVTSASASTNVAAAGHHGASAAPIKVTGTVTKLTHGTATRLASGDTSDTR